MLNNINQVNHNSLSFKAFQITAMDNTEESIRQLNDVRNTLELKKIYKREHVEYKEATYPTGYTTQESYIMSVPYTPPIKGSHANGEERLNKLQQERAIVSVIQNRYTNLVLKDDVYRQTRIAQAMKREEQAQEKAQAQIPVDVEELQFQNREALAKDIKAIFKD